MSSSDLPKIALEALNKGFHVQVLFINKISASQEPKATINYKQLALEKSIDKVTLEDVRTYLGKKIDSKWSFCLENSAVVDKTNALLYYLTLNSVNATKLQALVPKKDEEPVEPATLPVLTAYVCVEDAMAPVPRSALGWGATWADNNKADTTLTDRSKSQIGAPSLSASHKANYSAESAGWAAARSEKTVPSAGGMLDCVVDFADKDWEKIMMLNKLLYAFDVRGKQLQITSARLPAFELVYTKQGSTTAHLQPFVEIQDTPHIDITEVSTEFQSSLADNAFSSKAVEAMVSGGTPLVSVSVSAGMKSESSRGTASSEGGQRKEYHATYNFPRVRLFLDENTLTVSEYCDKALAALKDDPTLAKLVDFQRRFGTIFAQEVLLGGRLESTKAADSFATSSSSTAKESFKASVGAAVSYGPAAASVKGSTESQTGQDKSSNNQRGNSAISFTARGGDTLLCADPAAWAATVAVWRNWRVIQQDEPVSLQALLGRFEKYNFVPELFAKILRDAPKQPDPIPTPIEPPKFDANKAWKEDSMIRLWIGSNKVLWPLSIRDGDPDNEAAGPKSNDEARRTPGRDADTIFVNKNNGELVPQQENRGPNRFSFRKLESSGTWKPLNGSTIKNGDKVTLWCHSLGEGGWKSLDDAPQKAVQAMYNKDVRFNVPSQTFTSVNGYQPAIFTVELHHTKSSFTATFKTRLSPGNIHKTKCSCSRLNKVRIGSDRLEGASSRNLLLPETPPKTTVLRFIFRSAAHAEKATAICSSSQISCDSEDFRSHMIKILKELAALCEAEHLAGQSKRQPTHKSLLRPFRTSNLDIKAVSEEVRAKMLSPLTPSALQGQGLGYIYILRSQMDLSIASLLKIGFSKYHPEHRAHELASCIPVTEVVAYTPLLPHAMRVEALIHAELAAKRKVLTCGQCGQDHREWFEISHAESRAIVIRWSKWMLGQPYLEGILSDEWRAYLREQDFSTADPETTISRQWMKILNDFPRNVADMPQQKQLATYVNTCYFEHVTHRALGLKTGHGARIREAFQRGTDGGPLDINNFMMTPADFDSFSSKFPAVFDFRTAADCDQESLDAREAQLFEEMGRLKNLQTGSISVSDLVLGKTESPMGDVTLLSVVSLEAVRQMNALARSWFGYTPTHEGFQLLQEAYQRGEWIGNCPQFQLPKAFRKANKSKLSGESDAKMKEGHHSGQNQPQKTGSPQKSTSDTPNGSRRDTVRFVRSKDSDTWEFSSVLDDDFIQRTKEVMEVIKTPFGRALVEREAQRIFRHYGLNFSGRYEAETSSNSSDSDPDEMDIDQMDMDELEEAKPGAHTSATGSLGEESLGLNISKDNLDISTFDVSSIDFSEMPDAIWPSEYASIGDTAPTADNFPWLGAVHAGQTSQLDPNVETNLSQEEVSSIWPAFPFPDERDFPTFEVPNPEPMALNLASNAPFPPTEPPLDQVQLRLHQTDVLQGFEPMFDQHLGLQLSGDTEMPDARTDLREPRHHGTPSGLSSFPQLSHNTDNTHATSAVATDGPSIEALGLLESGPCTYNLGWPPIFPQQRPLVPRKRGGRHGRLDEEQLKRQRAARLTGVCIRYKFLNKSLTFGLRTSLYEAMALECLDEPRANVLHLEFLISKTAGRPLAIKVLGQECRVPYMLGTALLDLLFFANPGERFPKPSSSKVAEAWGLSVEHAPQGDHIEFPYDFKGSQRVHWTGSFFHPRSVVESISFSLRVTNRVTKRISYYLAWMDFQPTPSWNATRLSSGSHAGIENYVCFIISKRLGTSLRKSLHSTPDVNLVYCILIILRISMANDKLGNALTTCDDSRNSNVIKDHADRRRRVRVALWVYASIIISKIPS
ncbi:hypothetical protein LCI18_003856 [Fusarium solani-melongenae]|uniref:Uncharacterized protein n=1 Tax=Fusarium solani subsp. cucurbitae TaxID=2747967 RepID=A0ACD3YVG5_FUSSC|nr:hypothetical protein LCI18_003856 [Fusarium solani-melongenae]